MYILHYGNQQILESADGKELKTVFTVTFCNYFRPSQHETIEETSVKVFTVKLKEVMQPLFLLSYTTESSYFIDDPFKLNHVTVCYFFGATSMLNDSKVYVQHASFMFCI